jgi:raffinose/stachyose/melibiose transport system permease protein
MRTQLQKGLNRSIALSILPAAILFAVFFVVPIATLAWSSFTIWDLRQLRFNGFGNYVRMFQDDAFVRGVANTAIWVGVATMLHVPLGVYLAVVLSKKIRGWKLFRTFFFLPNVISLAAWAMMYRSVFNQRFGLLNSALELIGLGAYTADWLAQTDTALFAIILSWFFNIGFYLIITMAEIASIPEQLYEAAKIDGATEAQQDRYITFPLLRKILGTCMVLAVSISLVGFEYVFLMTGGGPANRTMTLPLYVYRMYTIPQYGYSNTIGLATLLFGIIAMLLINRTFRMQESDL